MKKGLLLLALFLVAGLGCKENPFDGNPKLSENNPRQKPEPGQTGLFSLDIQATMEFTEGAKGEYAIQAWVPAPGEAIMEFEGADSLVGFNYDESTSRISWTPDFEVVNGAGVDFKIFTITARLLSSANNSAAVTRPVNIIVHNSSRAFTTTQTANLTFKEGKEAKESFIITNQDYPQGPFNVMVEGVPGVQVTWQGANKFIVSFTTDYNFVTSTNNNGGNYYNPYYRNVLGKIFVRDPYGRMITTPVNFKIENETLDPIFLAATSIKGTQSISLSVLFADVNKEAQPSVEVVSKPTGGTFSPITNTNSSEPYTTIGNIEWSEIPASSMGTPQSFTFRSCVYAGLANGRCVRKNISVTIDAVTNNIHVDSDDLAISESSAFNNELGIE